MKNKNDLNYYTLYNIKEMIEYENIEGLEYLKKIENNSIDLILTDPPYIISRESGMNSHYNRVKEKKKEFMKTSEEWEKYKELNNLKDEKKSRII